MHNQAFHLPLPRRTATQTAENYTRDCTRDYTISVPVPLFSPFPFRFTLIAQSLFQIKRQLDKLGELVVKVTYESDPIPLQKPQMEERVKYLIYHLIKRY